MSVFLWIWETFKGKAFSWYLQGLITTGGYKTLKSHVSIVFTRANGGVRVEVKLWTHDGGRANKIDSERKRGRGIQILVNFLGLILF